MTNRLLIAGIFLAVAMIVGIGCHHEHGYEGEAMEGAEEATSMQYVEKEHNGRIYVIGNEETAKKLEDNGHIPYAKTFIGKGPGGKTVVVEIDKDNPELTGQLLAKFNKKHNLDIK